MARTKPKRKAQSRLSFEPLPSSSPAAKDYHPQIQDRAAAVRYGTSSASPSKRRRITTTDSLPTPEPSSKQDSKSPENDGDEIVVQQKPTEANTLRKRARQGRLDFSAAIPSSAAYTVSSVNARSSPRSSSQPAVDMTDSTSESDELPRSTGRKIRSRKPESFMTVSTHRSNARKSGKHPHPPPVDARDSHTIAAPSSTLALDVSSAGEEDDDEDDDMPTTLGTRRRGKQAVRSSPLSSSPPRALSSDDEVVAIGTGKQRGHTAARKTSEHSEPDEEEESEDAVKPKPGRRLKRRTQFTEQDQQDLDSDLEFLGNTSDVDADTPRAPRSTQSAQKNARMRALDALKQKRSGQAPERHDADDGDDNDDRHDNTNEYDTSSHSDNDLEDYDEQTIIPTSSTRAMFQADEDDADFLDDDDADDDALGVPEGIPLEFTRFASKKAKDLFEYAVEWMVQKKINPAFRAEDEMYDLAFKKLNDEVEGLVRSKFKSSAWVANFVQSLNSRPDIEIREMSGGLSSILSADHCDACNRTGHPASYEVQFTGKPYHPASLDPVVQRHGDDDDEDDSEDTESHSISDDLPAVDYRGSKVPPASKVYYVGRFCMANAETAHELHHWKIHLYEWVVQWLNRAGYNDPTKVVERDGWSTEKRRKRANKMVKHMADDGVIKQLWKEFSDTISRARDSKPGRW